MSGPYVEILRSLRLLAPPGGVFEVRALNPWTASGYYSADRLEQAAKAIEALDATGDYEGIYITLNAINPALLSRRANRIETRLPKNAATTSDDDVIRRRWLVVDVDAERASGISSTDEEHCATVDVAGKIAQFLTEFYEFPRPILANSGNGAHLLYRIDLPNDEESAALIKRCLQALGAMFDTPAKDGAPGWEVDPTMANAARICKLYGTVARKGDHTSSRPHRRAKILEVPDAIEVAPVEALKALAARVPEEEPLHRNRSRPGGYGQGIDLEDWLQEYGASLPSYHAKNRSQYTTFYEFEVCPWDPSHRDRSAWVGQLTSGALDAGCHHKGCRGYKWRDLRALAEPKQAKSTPTKTRMEPRREDPDQVPGTKAAPEPSSTIEAPAICTTGAAIHEMSAVALDVINQWNSSTPGLFARSACLVRAALDERQGLYIQEIDEAGLTGILDRLIVWYRVLKSGDERPARPPREVVRDILSLPAAAWRVPHLAGVTGTPIFHPDGTIHATPGYDGETDLYYYPATGFSMPPVPEVPTREDVTAALQVIGEVFADFPFCGPADQTNAIGALFTAVLRPGIEGPAPLYLVDKPQAGSGAGLLQRAIGWIAEGREPALKTMPTGPDMRKEIFAGLRNGTRIQIFDNLEDRLSSPELAAALTAAEMTGRILGQTEERTYTVRTFWMANGNNVTIGGDLARRTFKSRIDPQDPMPWQRSGFKHPDLIRWVSQTRGVILAAVFTVARAWIQAGSPEPVRVPRVGSFEAWRDMIGGILEYAGVPDFLANADEVYLQADEDRHQWENFLRALWKIYGCEPFTAGGVASRMPYPEGAILLDMLPDALAEAYHTKGKTFSRVLGRAFGKVDGRHFPGGWCIQRGKLTNGYRQWVITYSDPSQVDCKWIVDSSDNASDPESNPIPGESQISSGFSGLSPYTYAQRKTTDIKTPPGKVITRSKNECAIAVTDNPLNTLHQGDKADTRPLSESEEDGAVSSIHLQSTLPPVPPHTARGGGDNGDLGSWLEKIRLPRNFTIAGHRHNPDRPPGLCSVGLCNRQPAWEDEHGGWPICDRHYQLIKQREQAAKGVAP